ncbi:7-cyano-7-deazaguanine synthase QueC [Pseudidiomarina terrestris]|uniref:7-cyano-7-deazaguanine synthase n=1 Tax=Pseudidiomarina terrestris TaxID=2820060 RepID=A0AAW7R0P0_9GAMM|nr:MULTISPECIES: 7-cyano-7-deazaguanine synthase QueC [unclassified Pseudidiomarina]MDN7125698.1 7-cyano-7-deazaguanine synthase QueC [Pseudidiomarina sp. 1APP75-32.1]MDN7128142.1 7-cyano-7-deazaguanine synthase QueC [Pseudidiomarina sp. 1APR75-33.1]MDN7130660.1 7-cyano-7-deazaguanine synthase QueC [Pseudidiomarina sp. 1APR75-15]MDN7136575.1 7-cyano-7-deazaguanine synthase QueC [Pseudidiomarina sp. 1ASP75-5]MDN7138911.1 7-cyano-7-deazaguanine synthase QueC [Pseudidiomarina sp. 1ASP75-14]
MAKVVVIYSGGMDSFTVLNRAIRDGHEVYALSFNYGQRHVKELEVAAQAAAKLGVPHKVVDITAVNSLLGGSSLTSADDAIPEGHYAEDSMKSTVVPNRNMILLSLAIGYAVSLDASAVYYGAHSGDHAIYPDCRPEFVKRMNDVSLIANYEPISIEVPYLDNNKAEILADGLAMGLDYADTWTCYNGRELACGKCGACVERLEAFAENKVTDPLSYES